MEVHANITCFGTFILLRYTESRIIKTANLSGYSVIYKVIFSPAPGIFFVYHALCTQYHYLQAVEMIGRDVWCIRSIIIILFSLAWIKR